MLTRNIHAVRIVRLLPASIAGLISWVFQPRASAGSFPVLFASRVETSNLGQGLATVSFRSKPLLRLRSAGSKPTAQTAAEVALRLQKFYESGGTGKGLRIVKRGGDIVLIAGKEELVTVTSMEARDNQSTPEALARLWLQSLRNAFDLPWISVPPTVIPLGEDFSLAPQTNQSAKTALSVTRCDEDLLKVRTLPGLHKLILRGLKLGRTNVGIACGLTTCTFDVTVLPRAGRLLPVPEVVLFGRQVPVSLLSRALKNAIAVTAQIQPGARLEQGAPLGVKDLVEAGRKDLHVPVRIHGPGYFPTQVTPRVPLRFEDFSESAPSALWFSNSPEKLTDYGILFEEPLPAYQKARLLYHHKCLMEDRCDLVIEVTNYAKTHGALAIIDSSAGPDHDEIYTGHTACLNYLGQRHAGTGYQVTIPAGRRYRVATFALQFEDIASGIWELDNCGPADLQVQIRAVPRDTGDLLSESGQPLVQSSPNTHVYPLAVRRLDARYEAEGNWTFIDLGTDPARSRGGESTLNGNYGVEYRVHVTISNPLPRPEPVALVFAPTGGVARGVFGFVSDARGRMEWIEVPPCAPPHEITLRKVLLPPNTEGSLSFITMPEAGSNYPVRLVVRPARLP